MFEASLFQFHFISARQYLDFYFNEYPVKQIASLHLKLFLKPAFFSALLLFLGR